jgi:hypothetical protein
MNSNRRKKKNEKRGRQEEEDKLDDDDYHMQQEMKRQVVEGGREKREGYDNNDEGGRRRNKKKINDEGDNNKSGQDSTIVGIINVPEDVMMADIMKYLHQHEVVHGLSETNKLFSTLIRDRYGIEIKMYPNEQLSPGVWKNVSSVRPVSTTWARNGVHYENFMGSVKKNKDGRFMLKEVKAQLQKHQSCAIPFTRFDIQFLQTLPLEELKLEHLKISQLDLKIIQSMETLESLIVLKCHIQEGICLFPPKLKTLQVIQAYDEEAAVIEDLPECLESFECENVHLKRSTEAGFLIPPRLLDLKVTWLMDSERKFAIEILPFDLPATLLNLKISTMSRLETLPSLCLGSLKSIELSYCGSLHPLPPLPQTLLKLVIGNCDRIELFNLPNNLEELLWESCKYLELDISNLPMQLQKFSFRDCRKMKRTKQLDQLPVHLKNLELKMFSKLERLPSLQSGLYSLCLEHCNSFALLPVLPESLRELTLDWLPELDNMASLIDNLEELSLSGCAKLKDLDHIPHKLKYLDIHQMELLQILNFKFP